MKHIKVLIAEDSPTDVELLIHTLKTHYVLNFKCVETGEDFLNAVNNENWDVILADYSMPKFSAPEALSLLQETGKDIPFIIISGTIGEDSAVESLKSGAHDFITKANLSRLLPAIEREIRSAKARDEKRLSEESLKESERRFREIFENASDGLLLVDVDTLKFSFGNSTIYKMLGYELNEFNKLSVPDIHPKEHLPYVASQLEKIKRNEIRIARDIPIKRKDGTLFYTDINSFEMVYEGRKCLMGIFRDITDRKIAEEKLKESEERYRAVVEQATDAIYLIDPVTKRVLEGNSAFWNLIGYNGETSNGITSYDFVADEKENIDARVDKIVGEKSAFHGERLYRRKDGSFVNVWANADIITIGDREVICSIVRDITTQKIASEKLRQSEERYRSFFEDDLTGDYISTPEGRIIECNPAFIRIFGFDSVEDTLNYNVKDFFLNSGSYGKFIDRLVKEKKNENLELELRRADGRHVFIVENVVGEFDENGNLISYRGYVFDDTIRKALERQLFHSQKMESLGILAGGIAHDFNNLLGIIIGHTSLLEIFKSDPEKITQSIEAIARAAERGADLVRQMLTFARKSDLKLESVRINDVLQDLVKFLKETLPKTIEIINDLDPQLPSVVADQNQLHSVFLNLCVNARDAMPNGGSLKIKTRLVNAEEINKFKDSLSKNYVVVDIEDTGKGMDSTTLQRIFEPFFTTKDIGKGTGLGLSVAYGVVEKHKGYIEVESEIGKGTAFHLYFPVQMQEIEITEKISESMKNVSGGNETILFVEDEDYLVESTKMILEEKGYNVLVARDGSSAIELYLKNKDKISLILSDLGLPKMDGQEVHLRIKNYNPEIKFIIASGFLEPGRKSEMLKAGVKDFILKPYKLQDMLRIIRKVIDKN